MNKVFVDSDVILDLLAHRVPHFHISALLFTFADMNKIELYTSPTVFCNVFYILRKELGIEKAKESLRKLRLIVKVIDSSEKTIDSALNSVFSDFEDAIQYYTAQNHKLTTIVTRNVKDYKNSNLSVETPEMFLCSREFV